MPSNFTEHFQLNQWEPGDQVLREDFNADNAKIDAALAATPKIKVGTYTASVPVDVPYHVSVGFRPKAVLVWYNEVSGYITYLDCQALVLDGMPVKVPDADVSLIEIEDDGFFVQRHRYSSSNDYRPNLVAKREYLYIAFG